VAICQLSFAKLLPLPLPGVLKKNHTVRVKIVTYIIFKFTDPEYLVTL
jgi:hypothetical protein